MSFLCLKVSKVFNLWNDSFNGKDPCLASKFMKFVEFLSQLVKSTVLRWWGICNEDISMFLCYFKLKSLRRTELNGKVTTSQWYAGVEEDTGKVASWKPSLF